MIIIGVTGTIGAGKGVTVDHLKSKGFAHYSAGEYIKSEVKKRGMPVSRDSNVALGNQLRKEHSPSYIMEKLYENAMISGKNAVLESIRNVGEIEFLRTKGSFCLISVDADLESRYARILKRNGDFDHIAHDQFLVHDAREMDATDPNKQNLSECMRLADFKIRNDGRIKDLHAKIDKILEQLKINAKLHNNNEKPK